MLRKTNWTKSEERCVRRIQGKYKRLQNLGSEGQEIYPSRDVRLDEASMVKPTNSQQVESKMTEGISQEVEGDATSPSLERSV